jgi:O-antigen/teichoic acid export membrane protein
VTSARPDAGSQMSVEDIQQRAIGGAAIVFARNLLIRVLTFAGTLVIARILTPHDIGVVAIGLTLLNVSGVVAEAGLGAALIRRGAPPAKEDLETVLGFQFAAALAVALVTAAVALQLGEAGRVAALMVAALPLSQLRTPAVIQLERELLYERITRVEVYEAAIQYAWSVGAVVAGFGVWGLATGSIARVIAGGILMVRASPIRIIRPRFEWARLRPILGFGVKYQAAALVTLARDEGLNLGTAAIAGIATLGLWSLAFRILQLPLLLFQSLWRVSFPAMARLMAAGDLSGERVERGIGLVAVVSGAIVCALAGATPAVIVAAFGEKWAPVEAVIPWACLGIMVGAPVSVACSGYFYARGEASIVLRAVVAHSITFMAVSFPLLPALGVQALGIGQLASAFVDVVILGGAVTQRLNVRVVSALLPPVVLATAAGALGWLAASAGEETLLVAAAGGVVAEVAYLGGLFVFRRAQVQATIGIAKRGISSSMARP